MSRPFATLIGAYAAMTVLACAGAAAAEQPGLALGAGYTSIDAPLGAPTQLKVDLQGRVQSRCELVAPLADLSGMDMNSGGSVQGAFAIDCNTPFILRVRSERGGFATDAAIPGVELLAPYQVGVQLGTDSGNQNLGWCDAASLAPEGSGSCDYSATSPAGGWSSGEAVAIDQTGEIRLRWDRPAAGQARFGNYNDTITIELEVRS